MEHIEIWIERVAVVVELLAVAIMVAFILVGTVRWLFSADKLKEHTYRHYRETLGKALLIGLEILVAADIIRTVALQPTMSNVAALGALVLVRTFLGWSITVEIEGRWPWQAHAARGPAGSADPKSDRTD